MFPSRALANVFVNEQKSLSQYTVQFEVLRLSNPDAKQIVFALAPEDLKTLVIAANALLSLAKDKAVELPISIGALADLVQKLLSDSDIPPQDQ